VSRPGTSDPSASKAGKRSCTVALADECRYGIDLAHTKGGAFRCGRCVRAIDSGGLAGLFARLREPPRESPRQWAFEYCSEPAVPRLGGSTKGAKPLIDLGRWNSDGVI